MKKPNTQFPAMSLSNTLKRVGRLAALSSLLCLGLAVSYAQAPADKAPGSLVLAADGTAAYRIYAAPENAIESYAAEELTKYLGQISGATFAPFAPGGDPAATPLLIVGRNKLTDQVSPGIPYDKLGEDGFVIRAAGPHIVIAGANPRGTLYGVYWLLDRHLGVRWFSPDYTFVPSDKKPTLKKLPEMQAPRFIFREIFSNDGDPEPYRAHNLLNGKSFHRQATLSEPGLNSWSKACMDGGHNFHRVVTDKALHAGGQLAMMSPAVRKSAVQFFVDRAGKKKKEEFQFMGFSQEDRGWEGDSASRAFARSHGGTLAAPNIDMVLDVARQVREKHPAAKFSTMAYQWSFPPPTGITIPDYLNVSIAPNHADFSQPHNGPKNQEIRKGFEDWAKISNHLYIWDYITNFSGYMLPYPNLDSVFESIQWWATMPSFKGYFGQSSMGSKGAEFGHLRQWVGARLLWDPKQDWRPLVEEFVKGYYGEAAPHISEHIALLHESKRKLGFKTRGTKTPVTSPYLSFETMRRADELFAKAEQAVAGQPELERRVATARIGVDSVILFRRGDYATAAQKAGIQWNPDTQRRLQRVTANIAAAGVVAYGEGMKDMKSYLKTMELERTASAPLDLVKGLSSADWEEFNDLDLRIAIGGVSITPDKLASDGGALMMKGNTAHWGIQLKLDCLPADGKWKVFVSVRVDPGSGPANAIAFKVGVEPGGRREVKFSEVADGQYHSFEVPGQYINDAGTALWLAPPNSTAIKAMYVDRVVAIRVK